MRGSEQLTRVALAIAACGWAYSAAPHVWAASKSPDERLEMLETRIADLERELQRGATKPGSVRAPFDVVDATGKRIFRVGQSTAGGPVGAFVYNAAGGEVSSMVADAGGGMFRAMSDDYGSSVRLGAGAPGLGLAVIEQDKVRIELGRAPSNRFSLRVKRPNETILAALGEAQTGRGAVVIYDEAEQPSASMRYLDDGRPLIGVYGVSKSGNLLASLSQGDSGGGKLQLSDAAGTPMVEAGSAEGVGIVRTGPMAGGGGPFPGSFIIGKAKE